MNTSGSLKNPVTLYNLLKPEIRDAVDRQVILTEDLYYRGVLISKIGTFLDEETIYKLINIGFKRVNILLPDDKNGLKSGFEDLSILGLKKEFLKKQKCVIADKDGFQINQLVSVMKASYVKEENIYAVNNSIPVRKVIDENQPKFIFVDLNLYPSHGLKVIKEIRKFSNAHLFLTAMVDQNKTSLVDKLRKEVEKNNATLLLKPISSLQLRVLLLDSVSNKELRNFLVLRKYLRDRYQIA